MAVQGLVPNWLMVDATTGQLLPATALGTAASQSSYDASRLPYRLTLDWLWFKDDRAKVAIKRLTLPAQQFTQRGEMASAYNLDGTPAAGDEALSMYAGTLGGLLFNDDHTLVHRVYADKIFQPLPDRRY